jgi:AraC-like DNA-binding protein
MSYLKNHKIIATEDLDDLRDVLNEHTCSYIDVVGKKQKLEVAVYGVSFGGLELVHFAYGDVSTKLRSPAAETDDLMMFLATSGAGIIHQDKQEYILNEDLGLIRDIKLPFAAQRKDISSFALQLPRQQFKRHAHALIGHDADLGDLRFDTSIDMKSPGGRHVRNTVEYIAQSMDGPIGDLNNSIITDGFQELLLSKILTLLPNSYMTFLQDRPSSGALPFHLKRARDYIHANVHTSISLAQLTTAAGCGFRTLQIAFGNHYGLPPIAYIKSVRLRRVRMDLLDSGQKVSIAAIAHKWGFTHMGRFAQDYRKKFGEPPSQTLRSRK